MTPEHQITRPDLGDSDLQGLDETYRERCALRWWAAQEENRAMRQKILRDIKKAKRLREPPRKAWAKPVLWIAVLVAGPFVWALIARLAGG